MVLLSGANVINNSAAVLGGGMKLDGSQATFKNGRVRGNTAQQGAGFEANHGARIDIMQEVQVESNVAEEGGGAWKLENSNLRLLEGVIVQENAALTKSG